MPPTQEPSGPGASDRSSRLGPSLSLLGLALWAVTFATYQLLKPETVGAGEPLAREAALRLIIAFVLSGVGIFAASIVSALGLFLSLSERRLRPGPRATRGVVLGGLGVGALVIVVVEIIRVAFQTT